MRTYSIYDAKAKLSELIRNVHKFGPIIITERGKPVVQVSSVLETRGGLEARLSDLESRAVLKPSSHPRKSFEPVGKKRGAVKRFLESRD